MDPLETPIRELSWINPSFSRGLSRLGIETWRDLIEHYPRRHEDRSRFGRFPTVGSETPVCIRGIITKISGRYFARRKIVEATVEEGGNTALEGRITCRWFNQYYVQRMLAAGQTVVLYGRPKEIRNRIYFDHPEFEVVDETDENLIHLDRITPIYPLTEGLRQRALRELLYRGLERLDSIPDRAVLPGYVASLRTTLRQLHFPESWEVLEKSRQSLALAELVGMQLVVEQRRRSALKGAGERHVGTGVILSKFFDRLGFQPTKAQLRTMEEIRVDLSAPRPMIRLLQGDVGAGKTFVAVTAMLSVIEAGFQAALMVPTQVLAEQHYSRLTEWLQPLGVKLALRTGGRKEETFLALEGEADAIVGTHALLYDTESFSRLGLAVIDEQHKFGVLQRARLVERKPAPDLLVMTATPIPRTLAMTVYGDLDVSVLDEKPADRRPVITRVRSTAKLPEATAFLKERLKAGRQVYIIYPVIEESESLSVKAATTEFTSWSKLLAPASCGLLHGRLTSEEKESVMARFRRGEVEVLISTTVIEVGVDVPNATVMLIENAERFGLAQLHQLRGRIGRSNHQSYCILLTDSKDPIPLVKLKILEDSDNGFDIAEADLRFRGPGDLLGTEQSGLPPLRLADLLKDGHLIDEARGIARVILDQDPDLQTPANLRFRRMIIESGKRATNLGN
jgi:ATP-dependent DNA helicase RecG